MDDFCDSNTKVKLFMEDSTISNAFFSNKNIEKIQKLIITKVYEANNNFKICKQDENELMIVMRSMYLAHSLNLEYDIEKQIDKLNNMVINYCVPNIIGNIHQYLTYIEDRKSVPFFPNPVNDNLYIPLESNNIN